MPTGWADPADTAHRRARVVELRRQRHTWEQIGTDLGVSKQRAHRIYREALAEYPTSQLAEHRHEELEMIDWAVQKLVRLVDADEPDPATGKHVSARTRVEALSALKGWSEHRVKLLGLAAPTKSQVDIVAYDGFAAQLERMRHELGQQQAPAIEAADDVADAEIVEPLRVENRQDDA